MERKYGYHKRNRIIVTILFLARILLEFSFGFLCGIFKLVETREELINMRLTLNLLLGILFIIIFIWYALTLEFEKKWWIFPTIIVVGLLSIYLGWIPWVVLMGLLLGRSRKLTAQNKEAV